MVRTGCREGWTGLAPILLLAFVLRLGWALLVPVAPVSDASVYDMFARQIATGHGYAFPDGDLTVYWAVGPSALHGAFYALFGAHHAVVAAVNLAMGCALVAAIHAVARQRFGARVADLAGLAAALWPVWVMFTTVLNSELPCALFLMLALLARRADGIPAWARVALSTALLVASAYMRPTVLPLIPLLPLLDGGWRRPGRAALHVGLALLVAAALLTPWMERNRAAFGEPVLVSANFGANLWMGNNPASDGGYMPLPDSGIRNEARRDAHFKEQALAFIRADPLGYLRLCARRVVLSFDRETIGVVWNANSIPRSLLGPLKLVSTGYWLAALFLSLAGIGLFLWEGPLGILDALIVSPALIVATCVLVVGQDRYHLVMDPFVALFAAFAIDRAIARRAARAAGAGAETVFHAQSVTVLL